MTIINKVSSKTLMPGMTPVPDVPDAPTVGTVTDGYDGTATVAATAAVTGGTPTTYTITPTPTTSPATFTGTSPVTVTGLSDGTAYTFTAAGVNSTATGPTGSASSTFVPFVSGSYESIATVTAGAGGSSSISFTSIPSTYKHLQVRGLVRSTGTGTDIQIDYKLNSDAGSNYTYHHLQGNGSGVYAYGASAATPGNIQRATGASATSNAFGVFVMDILDYQNTNKYKTIRSLGGYDLNGSGSIFMVSNAWLSTSAVSDILIYPDSGNWAQYSQIALYGIKG